MLNNCFFGLSNFQTRYPTLQIVNHCRHSASGGNDKGQRSMRAEAERPHRRKTEKTIYLLQFPVSPVRLKAPLTSHHPSPQVSYLERDSQGRARQHGIPLIPLESLLIASCFTLHLSGLLQQGRSFILSFILIYMC